jgi:hypothetical protein
MTELDGQLLENLIVATLPLAWQVALGALLVMGAWMWARLYYRRVDPLVRASVGRLLGTRIIWVLRNSSSYETPFLWERTHYRYWSWGVAAPADRTLLRDGLTVLLSVLIVNVACGLWPCALFLWVFLGLKALSYVVFLPVCCALLVISSIFWTGRYEITGMR